jgi:hypothetical protein
VSDKEVPRKIFRPEREEVEKVWKNLHNEGLYYVCFSPNIIGVTKSRMVWWKEHVEHVE